MKKKRVQFTTNDLITTKYKAKSQHAAMEVLTLKNT